MGLPKDHGRFIYPDINAVRNNFRLYIPETFPAYAVTILRKFYRLERPSYTQQLLADVNDATILGTALFLQEEGGLDEISAQYVRNIIQCKINRLNPSSNNSDS